MQNSLGGSAKLLRLRPRAADLYELLCAHVDDITGTAACSTSYLAQALHVRSQRAVRVLVEQLLDVGLVSREWDESAKSLVYRVSAVSVVKSGQKKTPGVITTGDRVADPGSSQDSKGEDHRLSPVPAVVRVDARQDSACAEIGYVKPEYPNCLAPKHLGNPITTQVADDTSGPYPNDFPLGARGAPRGALGAPPGARGAPLGAPGAPQDIDGLSKERTHAGARGFAAQCSASSAVSCALPVESRNAGGAQLPGDVQAEVLELVCGDLAAVEILAAAVAERQITLQELRLELAHARVRFVEFERRGWRSTTGRTVDRTAWLLSACKRRYAGKRRAHDRQDQEQAQRQERRAPDAIAAAVDSIMRDELRGERAA